MAEVREQTDDERIAAAVRRALDELAPSGVYISLTALCMRVEEDLGEAVSTDSIDTFREAILGPDEDTEYERLRMGQL
jgi:hypothetical protein